MYHLTKFLYALCFLVSLPVYALSIEQPLAVVEQEARAAVLFTEVRCVACQSESLADSRSDIAADMRRAIRDQVSSGKSNEEIKAYLVSRYGDHILMRPPFKPATWLLWGGPALIFLSALFLVMQYFRKTSRNAS